MKWNDMSDVMSSCRRVVMTAGIQINDCFANDGEVRKNASTCWESLQMGSITSPLFKRTLPRFTCPFRGSGGGSRRRVPRPPPPSSPELHLMRRHHQNDCRDAMISSKSTTQRQRRGRGGKGGGRQAATPLLSSPLLLRSSTVSPSFRFTSCRS